MHIRNLQSLTRAAAHHSWELGLNLPNPGPHLLFMLLARSPSTSAFHAHLHGRRLPPSHSRPLHSSLQRSFPLRLRLRLPNFRALGVGGGSTSFPLNEYTHFPEEAKTPESKQVPGTKKSFWGAVSLIIGTAVGPGMLGLPSATVRSGTLPSTVTILLSWLYVVSSILLVVELSFAAMRETDADEVSFTALATTAFGSAFGALVAVVYASLSFSLLIACVSGIGSLVVQQWPRLNPVAAHAAFPCFVGAVIVLFPFAAIDITNRLLCLLMLSSISSLVAIGLSIGRSNLMGSLAYASWKPEAILPAIPVTVLTLGFHVITPFVCKIAGDSMLDTRRAILLGGSVPLVMVLSWNAAVLGLSAAGNATVHDPIKLLLSVNSSALPAVQGFAFAALATSLIGYAVSFPKQLADTVNLISEQFGRKQGKCRHEEGSPVPSSGSSQGCVHSEASAEDTTSSNFLVTWLVLIVPIIVASFFPTAFAKALDFAGVYANCFLFGILPPAMASIHRSRKQQRSKSSSEDLLPGGNFVLLVLFSVAVILGFWH